MDDLKQIISLFIRQPVENIDKNTIIDKTVVQGSILIHRMYAKISEIGFPVNDYSEITTYGQLMKKINPDFISQGLSFQNKIENDLEISSNRIKVGIDIENVSQFDKVPDYREDHFYMQNFSDREIAYCILQPNVNLSFAGKFAAKEAIVKCNNNLKNIPFNQIEILNNASGKPFYGNFALSISHANEYAVATAILTIISKENDNPVFVNKEQKTSLPLFLSAIAIIISIIALLVSLI